MSETEVRPDASAAGSESVQPAERRWYNHGQCYVSLEDFRATPMGRDILRGDPFDAEAEVKARFAKLKSEEEHKRLGGHWDLQEMVNNEASWGSLSAFEKVESAVVSFVKFCAIWGVLYLFIVSLGVMGDAFKIMGGRSSGKAFRDSALLANPVAGLAIGILATVLMQSSSTTTSIVISMAAADLVTIKNAAYLIMGANIGTSVTNTLVSIAHLHSPAEYRRAFTGAVFHDMFNWLTVGMFLPLEASSGFLVELASAAVDSLGISEESESTQGKVEFLKKITKPASGRVVAADTKLIELIAAAETSEEVAALEKKTIIKQTSGHVLRDAAITDNEAGVLLLFASLTMLASCLLLLVKLLQSVLKGRVAVWTRYLLNIEFKHPVLRACGGMDNYILLLFGTGCTILVQSSSVFTSTLTPLIGIGLIHIEKAVALTHGANIGTTVTGVLSALSGSNVNKGLRVALEHVFFNCLGTVLWFVIWPLRPVPLNMAKFLGETAANLRWFPIAYILLGFVAFPGLIIALSIPGWQVLAGVMTPILAFGLVCVVWVFLRRNRADLLPLSPAFFRAEQAPLCGWRYPNFMQLWGGESEKDEVDMAQLIKDDEVRAQRAAATVEWPYSPVAWGVGIVAFVAAVICIPTTQWRRVRYGDEAVGREDIGFGLWEICSKAYESDHKLRAAPTVTCGENYDCASELREACQSDATWATGEATASELLAYERAFTQCSKQGCRALAWETTCIALGDVCTGAQHNARCRTVLDEYVFYDAVNQDAHGVELLWTEPTGNVVADTVPLQNAFYEKAPAADKDVATNAFNLRSVLNTGLGREVVPALNGIAYDACTGVLHTVTSRNCSTESAFTAQHLAVSLNYAFNSTTASKYVAVNSSIDVALDTPNTPLQPYALSDTCTAATPTTTSATGIALSDVDVLDSTNGIYIAAEQYGPKVVIYNSTATLATYTTQGAATDATTFDVLPRIFAQASHSGWLNPVLAVNPEKTRALMCVSRLTHTYEPLAYGRLARCAMLNITEHLKPALLFQKVVLLQNENSTLAGASWLSGMRVALLEATTPAARVVEADFSAGSDINDVFAYNDMNLTTTTYAGLNNLELQLIDETARTPAVLSARLLFEMQVYPAPLRLLQELPDTLPHPSGLAVINEHTFVVTSRDSNQVHVVQAEEDVPFGVEHASCPTSDVPIFAGGDACRDINEICPGGDLGGDMEVIAALAITGTTLLGVGTVCITVYALWMDRPATGVLLYISAAALTVAWTLLFAAWLQIYTVAATSYSCYFADESLRGGFILHHGELQYLTIQSYSWAFCIMAWGCLTIAFTAVWARVLSLCRKGKKNEKTEEEAEEAEGDNAEKEMSPVSNGETDSK